MKDVVHEVLTSRRRTFRELRLDMKQARLWENWRDLAAMRRFYIKLLRDLPELYDWAASRHPSRAGRNPSNFEDIIRHMDDLVRLHIEAVNGKLETRLTATDQQTPVIDEELHRMAERLALALRNLRTKAKKQGIWSEGHGERFDKWMRLRR